MITSVASLLPLARGLLRPSTPCSIPRLVLLFTGCSPKPARECWISTSFVGITNSYELNSIHRAPGWGLCAKPEIIGKRTTPSVAGIIYPFGGQFVSKMYWGTSETLLPVYQAVDKACEKHPEVDTVNTPSINPVKLLI